MLTLYNFALDSRGREEEKKDNPCNTKQVAQEKREREKKPNVDGECGQKRKKTQS